MKKLYLIPTAISEDISCIPPHTIEVIKNSKYFVCERIRTTRRFIKSIIPDFDIDQSSFIELDKRNDIRNNKEVIDLLKQGRDVAFMSEAGSPCIADPGSTLVDMARMSAYRTFPLSGPSSIILALMASGMNGQNFTFRGYLPIKKDMLFKELKQVEKTISQTGFTQIFIETPYRNLNMFEAIMSTLSPNIRLNISIGIYSPEEYLDTMSIKEWKKDNEIKNRLTRKTPCIFIMGK